MEDVIGIKQSIKKGFTVIYDPRAVILHTGKHESINKGMLGIVNQATRLHLIKFFIKGVL